MHPFLFQVGTVRIPTFGLMALLAFAACVVVIRHYAIVEGLDPRRTLDAIVLSIAVGLLGARVLEAIVSIDKILADPAHAWTLVNSAGVYLGALLTAVTFGLWWFRRRGIPVLVGLDILGLVGVASMAIARWGCFFSGCCWGKPTDLPWGVTFPEIARQLHPDIPHGPVHPTQIYLSLNGLVLFGILVLLYRRKRFHGRVFLAYVMLYAVTRFFIEFVRGDELRGFVLGGALSTSQFIGIFLFAGGAAAYYTLARRHRLSGQPDWRPSSASERPAVQSSEPGNGPEGRIGS